VEYLTQSGSIDMELRVGIMLHRRV